MENRWERLAREDAEFYIWTDLAPGDDFFRSGERDAERILAAAAPHIARWSSAVEMGCGVGRITIPMSTRFGSVTAVDIAPTMLTKLEANCEARGVHNVTTSLARDEWDQPLSFDFAYSRIVFQHIDDWTVIVSYFERIARSLARGGVFYIQFDTRPANLLYHVRNALPDALLPPTFRRGVRRIRRSVDAVHAVARESGFQKVSETGAGTLDHELVLRKP